MPWLHFNPRIDLVPILQKAEWAPGPVWMGGTSYPDWDSISDHPTRTQSLYRLSYPAHIMQYTPVSEMHGTTVRHVSCTQIVEWSMKQWILVGYIFELWPFRRQECQVSAELRETFPSNAQTWCCSACSVMQQYLCASPTVLLHYTWSVNTYLWKWLICTTCLAMCTVVKVSLPVCISW